MSLECGKLGINLSCPDPSRSLAHDFSYACENFPGSAFSHISPFQTDLRLSLVEHWALPLPPLPRRTVLCVVSPTALLSTEKAGNIYCNVLCVQNVCREHKVAVALKELPRTHWDLHIADLLPLTIIYARGDARRNSSLLLPS